ncbi:MAG: 50S ribosomal protein L28 [Candidatus Zixiibacteriota bacterium]|nr:MAG: 50S ribosomal protein L28 [candidate division Zixibacteria bacterium]
MAKVCEICGKRPIVGNNVSHAHNLTRRRWIPNLQRVRAIVDGRPKKINVCTSCLKAGKVIKNVQRKKPQRTSPQTPEDKT